MPNQHTNIETLGTAIFARLDAQDALREASFKSITANINELTGQIIRLEERFVAHKEVIDNKFKAIEKKETDDKNNRREAGKERNNWLRTGLTLLGATGILKAMEFAISWFNDIKGH